MIMTGGCGVRRPLRYRAEGEPLLQGLCHCRNCQRRSAARVMSASSACRKKRGDGGRPRPELQPDGRQRPDGDTLFLPDLPQRRVRPIGNHAGPRSTSTAGSLDDLSWFKPAIAIFTRSRPAWDNQLERAEMLRDGAGMRKTQTNPSRRRAWRPAAPVSRAMSSGRFRPKAALLVAMAAV